MGFADALTTKQMNDRILRELATQSLDNVGRDGNDIVDVINEAAREVANEVIRMDQDRLVYTRSYSVSQGDADLDLPDGSDPQYPRWRKIIGVTRTDESAPLALDVLNRRQLESDPAWFCTGSYAVYLENSKLVFAAPDGAPADMTVAVRYVAALPLATRASMSATPFDLLPTEWTDAIVDLATAKLVPIEKPTTRAYYENRARAMMGQMRAADSRPQHTGTTFVRREW
jgi:hypothetical protein